MISFFKRNIFIVLGISIILLLFEIFTDWHMIGLVGLSFILMIISLFISNRILHSILLFVSVFLLIIALLLIDSIWILILSIILLLILFRTNQGNEFFHIREALIYPRTQSNQYKGIQLIQPQSEHRVLLSQQSIFDIYDHDEDHFEWDDVNLVYIGGNHIIDLGNTILPERETTVVIRKIYGRVRIIVPNEIGFKLNCSVVSGSIRFETQSYPLTGENFKWMSPDYQQNTRKINLIISVVFGDIEVIIS